MPEYTYGEYTWTNAVLEANQKLRQRIAELEEQEERLRDVIDDLKCDLRIQEDYTEMLMRWMSRKSLSKEDTASVYKISAWQDFCREYPSDAAALEEWLEERYA